MARQGYDLQLTRYDEKGWRATFYTTGMDHSPTSAAGTGWRRTLWRATQRAAWEVVEEGRGEQRHEAIFIVVPHRAPELPLDHHE